VAASAICLIAAGVVRASLPTSEFTLAWVHSVEKTRWEEHYRLDAGKLALVSARVQGLGAGVEPPPDATLHNGWWNWRPRVAPLPELRLTESAWTRDYQVCWSRRCTPLAHLVGATPEGAVITLKACP